MKFVSALRRDERTRSVADDEAVWRRFETLLNDDRQVLGNLIPDAYLAAIALNHKVKLATRDRGFGRLAMWPGSTQLGRETRRLFCGNTSGNIPRMAKVMVSLPDDLLAWIDRKAARRSTSRSALLSVAAVRELERRDSDEVATAITQV